RRQPLHGADRSDVCGVRWPPGPCLRRRAGPHRAALLHQLGFDQARAEGVGGPPDMIYSELADMTTAEARRALAGLPKCDYDVVVKPLRYRTAPRGAARCDSAVARSEEHTSELQSRRDLVCRLLLEKKKKKKQTKSPRIRFDGRSGNPSSITAFGSR